MQLGGSGGRISSLVMGGIELNDIKKQVTLDGELINLTPTEYEILKLLMGSPGKVFSLQAYMGLIYCAVFGIGIAVPLLATLVSVSARVKAGTLWKRV